MYPAPARHPSAAVSGCLVPRPAPPACSSHPRRTELSSNRRIGRLLSSAPFSLATNNVKCQLGPLANQFLENYPILLNATGKIRFTFVFLVTGKSDDSRTVCTLIIVSTTLLLIYSMYNNSLILLR